MKLVTFVEGAGPELGAIDADVVIPLSRLSPALGSDMRVLIARWPELEHEVRRVVNAARTTVTRAQVRLLAPIPRPGKILAIGLNYADHIAETKLPTPPHQVWFCKHTSAVNAPFDPIQIPRASSAVDYEVELVAVIGQGGRHIAAADARAAVFGYCVGNDVTVRDWQMRTSQWMLGKSFDSHAPFGPWITTADEVPDPHVLGIRCFVNGDKRQDSNTRDLVYDVWAQVAHVSQAMTLEPGDLLFTGTPGGVGFTRNPPAFLQAGDRVRLEIDTLGAIEAECVAEAEAPLDRPARPVE
jgi:ureidoglycolate lyase